MKIPHSLQLSAYNSTDNSSLFHNEHWIPVPEAAALTNRTSSWLIKQIEKGNLNGIISDTNPVDADGNMNYVVLLEDLSSAAQKKYFISHLPEDSYLDQDFISQRFKLGRIWDQQLVNISVLIQQVIEIRRDYKNKREITTKLKDLAQSYGISLATLYRFTSQPQLQKVSLLYLDPVYMQDHLPYTMCLRSVDFAYALYLDENNRYSNVDIFHELQKRKNTPCQGCPYSLEKASMDQSIWKTPVCRKQCSTMVIPNNPKTVRRVTAHIPPSVICYCRDGFRAWRSEFAPFSQRFKPLMVGDLFQGDNHVCNLFVRTSVYQYRKDRRYEKEIIVRPVFTAWMDSASGCIVGWVVSVLPDSDTIAEAFCRAVALTVDEPFNSLPKAVVTDCGHDYKSALLEDIPDEYRKMVESQEEVCLNRRFAGLGILRAMNISVSHCLPFHPQSKPIERAFSTIENYIEKLPGWCYRKASDRPPGFMKRIHQMKEDKTLLTLEEFACIMATAILPAYHGSIDQDITDPELPGWSLPLSEMTPMQKYQHLPKARNLIPSVKTLSALKQHYKDNCLVQSQGIRFNYVYYDADELKQMRGYHVSILYFNVTKPYAPASITVIYQNNYVCEAYPKQMNSYMDVPEKVLSEISHDQNSTASEIRKKVTRIRRNTCAILPDHFDAQTLEKFEKSDKGRYAQLKEEAFSVPYQQEEKEYEPNDPDLIQKSLDMLFGPDEDEYE